jgi:dihydroorotate dehydrogenase (fumarate)
VDGRHEPEPDDGVKAILAGAHAVQMVSAILRHGPTYIGVMRARLADWMTMHSMATLDEVRGRLSLSNSPDPAAFERGSYLRTLSQWAIPDWIGSPAPRDARSDLG